MSTYATISDVQDRLKVEMTDAEESVCQTLLEDAAMIIDTFREDAAEASKKVVSCRMVIRALNVGSDAEIPVGASQGSMSALGYAQSWTLGSGGGTSELYLTKQEKMMLGGGNSIGSHSPVEELAKGMEA